MDIIQLDNPETDSRYITGILKLHEKTHNKSAATYLYPQNETFYRKNINGECLNTIAIIDNTIVGYGALRNMNPWPSYLTPTKYPPNQCALLLINLVDPDFRGRGIGSLLCKSRLEMAKKRNYRHLFATVHPQNTPSIKTLTKFGFKIIEKRNVFEQQLPRYILYADLEATNGL